MLKPTSPLPEFAVPVSANSLPAPTSESSGITRRVIALLDAYPTLSLPIATAMVERAAQAPTGTVLAQLESALDQFDMLPDMSQLSGSQVRVLDVALRQVSARISLLQTQLYHAWEND